MYMYLNFSLLGTFFRMDRNKVCEKLEYTKWASSWDYGTYHIGDQRRLRQACASAQSRQSLCCLHTWSIEVDEGSDKKIRHLAPLDGCTCVFEVTEDEKYHNLMRGLKLCEMAKWEIVKLLFRLFCFWMFCSSTCSRCEEKRGVF